MRGAHGGLLATLIATVSFFPKPLLPSGVVCTTVNLNVSFVRAAVLGDFLTARSELQHRGRRTASVTARVTSQDGLRLVAHGTATLMILEESAADGGLADQGCR